MSTWPSKEDDLLTFGQQLVANSKGAVASYEVTFGELTIEGPADRVAETLALLRDRHGFHQLMDLTGVDRPERPLRFDVVYHLLSMTTNRRIRLKVQTDEDTAVPTATGVYPCADWYERECFNMYGVFFDGHPDLRRILTDYGFIGHPLRKDFPVSGHVEMRYDAEKKRVIYQPVTIEPREITPRIIREDNYGGIH